MKRIALNLMSLTALSATVFLVACDWESGSQANYNSRSNNVNISGVYEGQLSGGRAVSNTSNGSVRTLNIQQSGNTIRIVDNQGSRYDGRVSAPDIRSDLSSDSLVTGTVFAAYQIGFEGKDTVAARDVEFTGSLTLGTITTVQASSSSSTTQTQSASTSPSGSSQTTSDNQAESSNSFDFNETNAAIRLRGTWIEKDGVVASVNAVAPVNAFTITSGF